ncbi:hypothetical protein L6164_017317 [Bauhinia variegata]|uniref:Uncharacterized protein n=1 Tax=Bauhinia variegata TaxID=167791 RepID=A0ACB9N7Q6_BAUVA|nr:hypothetical protein L6164_017317 [Bauhinia variegata]
MTTMSTIINAWVLLVGAVSVVKAQDLIPGFVQTSGTEFVLNGSPFLFNGFNSYWLMVVASDPTQRYKVSGVFHEAASAGLSVCRTWAFSDGGYQALQKSPGVYDELLFQALDFVISEARKYRIKLILSLVNNYNDFGGKHQYVEWAISAGVPVTSDDDFYTNGVIKGYYKNNAKAIITRINSITRIAYKEDPTIMAWELMNEPRCQVDVSGKTLNGWIQEMASYLKSIDNKHLLAVGMEGFYGDSTPKKVQYNPGSVKYGTDFITNNLIKEIDYTTIHAYADIWLKGEGDKTKEIFMERWFINHWNDSRTVLKKPLVFGEFGKSKKDPGYTTQSRDSFMNTTYSFIYNFAKNGATIAGGLVWQVMSDGMESYYDGYEIVLTQDTSTRNIMSVQALKMASLAH